MKRPLLIYASLVLLTFVWAGILLEPVVSAKDDTYKYLANFADTLELVQRNYVDEVPLDRMVDGAYSGLLEELDAESYYLTPELLARYRAEPASAGLGIDVSKRNGYAIVVSVLPGSPADGQLTAGDYIRAIDGRSTRALTLFDVRQSLEGAAGTPVKLKVVRRNDFETVELELRRAEANAPALIETQPAPSVLGLRLTRIDDIAVAQVKNALVKAAGRTTGVILDLRGCSRGTLEAGANLANLFIDAGPLLRANGKTGEDSVLRALGGLKATRETAAPAPAGETAAAGASGTGPKPEKRESGYTLRVDADPAKTVWRGELAVLIDFGTAGPAEVTAAAVRSADRATVLGAPSFGRGSVQDLILLEGGAAVRLTVARLVTHDDKSLANTGLEPDELIDESEEKSDDAVMRRAIEKVQATDADGRKKKAA